MTTDFKIPIDGKTINVAFDDDTQIYEVFHPTFGSFNTRTIIAIYHIVRALNKANPGQEQVPINSFTTHTGVFGNIFCCLTPDGKIVPHAKFSCNMAYQSVSYDKVYDDLITKFFGNSPGDILGIGVCTWTEETKYKCVHTKFKCTTQHDTIISCILVHRALQSFAPNHAVIREVHFGYTLEIDNDGVTYTPEQDKSIPIRSSNIDSLLHHLHIFEVNKTLAAELPKMIESTPLNHKYTALDQVSQIRKQVFVLANITNEHRLCSTDLIGQMLKLLAETETQILTDD